MNAVRRNDERSEGRLTVRHHFRHASQTATPGAAAAPTKSEAKRNGEGRQGEGVAARLSATLFSRSAAEVNQKISGWLAGRWRLLCGAAVDVAILVRSYT